MALTQEQINEYKARYSPQATTNITQERQVEDPVARLNRIKESTSVQTDRGFLSKAGSFAKEALVGNTLRLGKTAGEAIAAPGNVDLYSESAQTHQKIQADLVKKINENKKAGKDTSRLEKALETHNASAPNMKDFTGDVMDKTTGQVLGEGLGTVLEMTTGGVLSGVAKNSGLLAKGAQALSKADKAYKTLSFAEKAGRIGKDTAKMAAITIPFGYGYDVAEGLQGRRGEEREGMGAFRPGMSTAISTAIPLTFAGIRLAKAGVSSATKSILPRVSSNLGAAPEGAYRQAQKGGVGEFMGDKWTGKNAATPESVFLDARKQTKILKKTMQDQFGGSSDDIINKYSGKRIGITEKDATTLKKIAERFGFEDRLPKNLKQMSAKETMGLLEEINAIPYITDLDDPLIKNLKLNLGGIKEVVKERAIKQFGGTGGDFDTIYQQYSKTKNVIDKIENLVGSVVENPMPTQQTTYQNKLMSLFNQDKNAYYDAVKAIDDATGGRLLDKIAAAHLSPILPKGLKGGPTGILGAASDLFQLTTLPLSSPRMSNWFLSKASGYPSVVMSNVQKSSPVIRQAIYKAVVEENKSLDDAINDVWRRIQTTPNKQGGFAAIGSMSDDLQKSAAKSGAIKQKIDSLRSTIKAVEKTKQTPATIAFLDKKKKELAMLTSGITDEKALYDTTKAFGANTRNTPTELKDIARNLDQGIIPQIDDFRYHTTSKKALEKIKTEGLRPAEGQYGKGVYFAPSEELTKGYGSPDDIMIRADKNKLKAFKYDEFPEQGWADLNVPPDILEYKTKGTNEWKPLINQKASVPTGAELGEEMFKKAQSKSIPFEIYSDTGWIKAPTSVQDTLDDIIATMNQRGKQMSPKEITETLLDDPRVNRWFKSKYKGNEFNFRQDIENYMLDLD